jgi:diguanylate cyclase (GGDEF)-like protein
MAPLESTAAEAAMEGGLPDMATDRSMMARTLGYLFAAGAGLAVLSIALPRSFTLPDVGVAAPVIALAITGTTVLVALLVRGREVLKGWTFQLVLASGTLLVTSAIFATGAASSYSMFYVLIALYAAYFFSRGETVAHVAFASAAYATAILAHDPGRGAVARWLITVGILSVAATLISTLKERLEGLIARLADAARTDVLTGLLNRRGFQDAFETELERAKRSGRRLSLIVGDLDRFKELNDRYGHRAGDDALGRVAAVMKATKRRIDVAARIGGEEFAVVVPETDEHEAFVLADRVRRAVRKAFADGDPRLTISFGVAAYPKHGRSPETLFHAGDQALYAAKELGRDRTVVHNPEVAGVIAEVASRVHEESDGYLATLVALAEALESRDDGVTSHSRVVSRYAELIARAMSLPPEVVDRVRIGGVLHDLGKIGVPESVLNKRGPLDEEDWEEIHRHPLIAARILDSSTIGDIRSWVLTHHERPDGLGYPNGLAGDEIPLEARILAVADAYEAMTSDRVYRTAMSPGEARLELERNAGTQFDEDVVGAFLGVLDRLGVRTAA